MSKFSALPPAVMAGGWSWSIFWLVSPFLVMAVLLAVVVLVALFRAPRTEVATILSIFVSAFRYLAARTPGTRRTGIGGVDVVAEPSHGGSGRDCTATKADPA